jgi:hypothetical protein
MQKSILLINRLLECEPLNEKRWVPHPPFPDKLYHGSKRSFESFDLGFFGATDDGYYGIGVYLSPSVENANDFGWHLYECKIINPKPFYLWSSSTMGDDLQAREDLSRLPEFSRVKPDRNIPTGYHIRKRVDDGNGYRNAGKVYGVMPKKELYDQPDVMYGDEHSNPHRAVVAFNDERNDTRVGGGWTMGLLKELGRKNFSKVLLNNGYNCLVLYDAHGVGEVMVPDPSCIRITRSWVQKNKYDVYEAFTEFGAAPSASASASGRIFYHGTSKQDNAEERVLRLYQETTLTSSRVLVRHYSEKRNMLASIIESVLDDDEVRDAEWLHRLPEYTLYSVFEELGIPYPDFNARFWERPQELYHATPDETVPVIQQIGLRASNKTRGISNRSIGSAVFTSSEIDDLADGSYGSSVFSINTSRMKQDGYTPVVSQEPDVEEAEVKGALAYELGIENFEAYIEQGMGHYTVIIHGAIPPKYINLVES